MYIMLVCKYLLQINLLGEIIGQIVYYVDIIMANIVAYATVRYSNGAKLTNATSETTDKFGN